MFVVSRVELHVMLKKKEKEEVKFQEKMLYISLEQCFKRNDKTNVTKIVVDFD